MGWTECDRCQFYARSPYTVCAVHPFGVDGENCLDFREDPNVESEELWFPEGARYIDDELVVERSYYNGEEIRQPQHGLTLEEQWEILETHPFFTGIVLSVNINSPVMFLSLFTLIAPFAAGSTTHFER